MTFTVDYDTDVGKVRLLVRDDDKSVDPLFSDEQITAYLAHEGSVREAAAACCEALAIEFSGAAKIDLERGNIVIDRTKAANHYSLRAQELRRIEEKQPYSEYQQLEDETIQWRDGLTGEHEHDPQDVWEDE